jgi:hypothetical protein
MANDHWLLATGRRGISRWATSTPRSNDAIQPIIRLLERARVDRQALLRQAFRFPQTVREQRNVPFLLIPNEFQEIRTLENFTAVKNATRFIT